MCWRHRCFWARTIALPDWNKFQFIFRLCIFCYYYYYYSFRLRCLLVLLTVTRDQDNDSSWPPHLTILRSQALNLIPSAQTRANIQYQVARRCDLRRIHMVVAGTTVYDLQCVYRRMWKRTICGIVSIRNRSESTITYRKHRHTKFNTKLTRNNGQMLDMKTTTLDSIDRNYTLYSILRVCSTRGKGRQDEVLSGYSKCAL